MGAKTPFEARYAGLSYREAKRIEDGDGVFWTGGGDERRTVAAAGVSHERELGYGEDLAARFCDRTVHLSVTVFEDAQGDDLRGELAGVSGSVANGDADEKK